MHDRHKTIPHKKTRPYPKKTSLCYIQICAESSADYLFCDTLRNIHSDRQDALFTCCDALKREFFPNSRYGAPRHTRPLPCLSPAAIRPGHSSARHIGYNIPKMIKSRVCPTGIAALKERMARQNRAKAIELFYERDSSIAVALVAKFIATTSSRKLLIASDRAGF